MEIGRAQTNVHSPVLPATPALSDDLAARKQLIQAVKAVNTAELLGENRELTFSLDRESRRTILRIVDRKTREVVRQIPPEYVLRLAEDLKRGIFA